MATIFVSIYMRCTLAPPEEYDWTVHVWRRYGLMSNYFDHLFIIRLHRSTTYVDAAYSYRPSSVVCRSVCDTSQPCKNGCTDRAAVWVEDLGGPWEPRIRWGSRSPYGKGQIFGGEWACILAPPEEYDWTVHARRRCGLMSNYFDHLLLLGCITVLHT